MAPEVASFIRAQPPEWGYARLAEACRAAFGDAAPDRDAIRAWWLANGRATDPRKRLARDPEVAEAVRDLAGRLTVPAIMKALAGRFLAARVPPRSTLYRHVSALLAPADPAALRPRRREPANKSD